MESIIWLGAIGLALVIIVFTSISVLRKLIRFAKSAQRLKEQFQLLEEAKAKNPEITEFLSQLNDDPTVHEMARRQLQSRRRKLKTARERRLASRLD
jgi:cell division protein FtsB